MPWPIAHNLAELLPKQHAFDIERAVTLAIVASIPQKVLSYLSDFTSGRPTSRCTLVARVAEITSMVGVGGVPFDSGEGKHLFLGSLAACTGMIHASLLAYQYGCSAIAVPSTPSEQDLDTVKSVEWASRSLLTGAPLLGLSKRVRIPLAFAAGVAHIKGEVYKEGVERPPVPTQRPTPFLWRVPELLAGFFARRPYQLAGLTFSLAPLIERMAGIDLSALIELTSPNGFLFLAAIPSMLNRVASLDVFSAEMFGAGISLLKRFEKGVEWCYGSAPFTVPPSLDAMLATIKVQRVLLDISNKPPFQSVCDVAREGMYALFTVSRKYEFIEQKRIKQLAPLVAAVLFTLELTSFMLVKYEKHVKEVEEWENPQD